MTVYAVDKLISETRRLAAEYRRATGTTLPVTPEIARHDAARLLGLELTPQGEEGGYDAVGRDGRWAGKRIQIKGRVMFRDEKGGHQRLGQFKTHQEWDSVMLVVLDEDYEPTEVYEAEREDILEAVGEGGSSRRSKRGALSLAKFRIISELVWDRDQGVLDDGYWDNTAEL